jgi:hypothetical protein
LLAALGDRPAVLLHGARQTGKSTLAAALSATEHTARYLTLDDAAVLAAARTDPTGFIDGLTGSVVLDEIQRAPELLLPIKASVDRDRRPGRFLLTGSANVLLLPRVADTLVGRLEVLTLWPLSQGEIEGRRERFIDTVFSDLLPSLDREEERWVRVLDRMARGGYPEVLVQESEDRRGAWFASYITTLLQRDVRDIANIDGLTALPRLLSLLATRSASLLNVADISRSAGLPMTTLKRYLALLEMSFLVQLLPPWFANLGKRLVKTSKLYVVDSGLLAHLLGVTGERLALDSTLTGPLLESFVVMELRKQLAWSSTRPGLFYFRTSAGHEVDVVLEARGGKLVAVEVKASATIGPGDFKSLRSFAEATGKRFHRGVLLYAGAEAVPFGPRLHALPVSALWRLGARPHAPQA